MIININDELYQKCLEFAEKRIKGSSGLYAYRGESSSSKMIDDCLIGTLGEWGAYLYLKSQGITTTEPDLVIYPTRRKSFNADLVNEDYNFHVKSQSESSFSKYGASWLLQKTDKIVSSPGTGDYFVFTKVVDRDVEILGVCRALDIVELYGECRIARYRHSKVALYLDELVQAGIKLDCLSL